MTRKYTKKSDYWDKKSVNKATEPASKEAISLAMSPEIGTVGLNSIRCFARFLEPFELAYPESLKTYREMGCDADIATALDASYTLLDRAFFDFEIKCNNQSPKSRKAAKFVDFCLRNMEKPLRTYLRSLFNYKQYGFAIAEKVYETDEDPKSPYYGSYRLSKIAVRPQHTLDLNQPFVFSSDGREVVSIKQNIIGAMFNSGNYDDSILGMKYIPIEKAVIVGHDITESRPMGESPLRAIYQDWREKVLIKEYEVIGVSKDLGGIPVLEVPTDILNRANLDPSGKEAESLLTLQQNIANIHAGEQSYMVMPSDLFAGTSMRQYSVTFQGIEGAGKQFDTNELIETRQKAIYNRFGAGSLLTDTNIDITGDSKSLLSLFVERDKDIIVEAVNSQIIPQLLSLNGYTLSEGDIPKFASRNLNPPNVGENASAIQRAMSVGAIPLTPEVMNEFMRSIGLEYRIPDNIVSDPEAFQEFVATYVTQSTSRAGDGMKTPGEGTSTTVSGQDPSVANVAND